ncbi:uncharacterized protein N7482_006378 [Penicillium canariense]|uniref:F-box domain-containing protein n=1 Tax=Penicillium canariense TaxID=189055 RepID=A0A9W9HUG1_9EURO|nr:uncharacterized protein N7482_006378 [Penicillium canariense]KAJ5159374.1 hypothetical protein N7482_006378 [Penicillium canariense]
MSDGYRSKSPGGPGGLVDSAHSSRRRKYPVKERETAQCGGESLTHVNNGTTRVLSGDIFIPLRPSQKAVRPPESPGAALRSPITTFCRSHLPSFALSWTPPKLFPYLPTRSFGKMSVESFVADPLTVLPPEIVLRILEFSPVSAVASLIAVSKAWHRFIDVTHQQAIYGSESKTTQPAGGVRDFAFLSDTRSVSNYFSGTTSWKDLCKRQTLLARNWAARQPISRETVLQVGNDPVWRFRADFKRRFFISTSHAGGLNVIDMDSGRILWRLPSTLDRDEDAVRPYAHLEYQDGMAVFDREGDAVEVWQTGLDGTAHGEFRRMAILNHDCQTRGFQLSYWTLCVVSNEGQGFVYDMSERPPVLTTRLEIEPGAIGHLDQSEDAVIYSLGTKGYYVYDKQSGALLGTLQPSNCTDKYHICPPPAASSAIPSLAGVTQQPSTNQLDPSTVSRKDGLMPIEIVKGPLLPPPDPEHIWHGENEWGAGMLCGELFVGFSRAGRVFICPDWRKALHDHTNLAAHSTLLECESDGSSFDLGGWLSVRDHRLMFEIQDRIYIVSLDKNNRVQDLGHPERASFSLLASSAPQLAVPVSFMALCDDAIMTTYTTLGWRQSPSDLPGGIPPPQHEHPARIFPTKAIRIVSLAPDISNSKSASAPLSGTHFLEGPMSRAQSGSGQPTDETFQSQAALLQLVSLLGDEPVEWEDEGDFENEE